MRPSAKCSVSLAPTAGTVLGMLSVAGILHLETARQDTGRLEAWQIFAYEPLAVDADTPAEVARQMLERQVRHVVAMRQHDLPGVISALDFVKRFPAKTRPEDSVAGAPCKESRQGAG